MTRNRRSALVALLALGNLILAGVVAYQVLSYESLSAQNAGAQRQVLSDQQEAGQLRSNVSRLTAENNGELATLQELNLTASSLGTQIMLAAGYLSMQNVTTLVSNKSITIMPVIPGTPYSAPNMTFILSFTAKYAGYLVIRSNVTTDAFVQVQIFFPVCDQHIAICQTTFTPSINGYRPPLIPVLPGEVIVEVGSNAPISPQHAWVSVQYTS